MVSIIDIKNIFIAHNKHLLNLIFYFFFIYSEYTLFDHYFHLTLNKNWTKNKNKIRNKLEIDLT